jgi:phytoene dehydrogenase-like protein
MTESSITNYKVSNPEFSEKNKSSLVIAEYDSIDRWLNISKEQYKKQKQETQEFIIRKASKITGIPFEKAEVCFSGTPKTMAIYSGDEFGGMIGAELNIRQGALNRWKHTSHIKNLILTGSDSPPSGGVSSCLDSGVIAGNSILRRN